MVSDNALDDRAQVTVVVEAPIAERKLTAALDIDRIRPVDHDFRNSRIAHEIFERSEAQQLVDDLLLQFGALFDRFDVGAFVEQLAGHFADLGAQLGDLLTVGVRAAGRHDVDALRNLLVDFHFEPVALVGSGANNARRLVMATATVG